MPNRLRSGLKKIFLLTFLPTAILAAQANQPDCHSMDGMDLHASIEPELLPPPVRLTGIGNVSFAVTANEQARAWFQQGINLYYDFWDYEADRAFEQAVRADPKCAMCYWGLYKSESFSHSNNKKSASTALGRASALMGQATDREKLYIRAAEAQDAARRAAGDDGKPDRGSEIAILRRLVKAYPQDTNASLSLAEALSDGYDEAGQPRSGQRETIKLIRAVLTKEPENSAANHLWIHALEAGARLGDALESADKLASLAPSSGHMVHMPGHIYYLLGEYARAQKAFDASQIADEKYMEQQRVAPDDDWNYVHNLMYSVGNLLEMGRFREAAEVSAKLIGARGKGPDTLYVWSARDATARINPQLPIALRQADWIRAIALLSSAKVTAPTSLPHLQLFAAGLLQYCLGMKALQGESPGMAEQYLTDLDRSIQRSSPDSKADGEKDHKTTDADLQPLLKTLGIMSLELKGSLDLIHGDKTRGEELFSSALRQQIELGYHEPPPYIRPVSECEGDALLRAGDWAGARTAYLRALTERPHSGFPLYGIALASEKAGNRTAASDGYRQFLEAWKTADPGLPQVEHAKDWLAGSP